MTTVIRKATAPDLLAAVPSLIDRDPLGSVVLVAFRGKRTHAALRLDIPTAGEKRFASTALGLFCKIPDIDDVVPVVSSDAPVATHAPLLATLVRRFQQSGFAVRDALIVGSDGWASHYDPAVHPLSDIAESAARLALDAPSERPQPIGRADDLAVKRVNDELQRIRMLVREHDDLDVLDPILDLPYFAEGALDWSDSEFADRAPLLLFALQGPPARDLVMLQWAFGLDLGDALWSEDTCLALEARKRFSDVDEFSAELMLGRGPRPSTPRVESAIALLSRLIAHAEDADRPAPLCMLSWLHWALGHGSSAGVHIDSARRIAPDYSMAQLLDTLYSTGAMPEWLFTSPSSE